MENQPDKKFSLRFLGLPYDVFFRRSSDAKIGWSRLMWWCILIYCVNDCFSSKFKDDQWTYNLGADGIGYYAYLPATFIYHDFTYSFIPALAQKYPRIAVAATRGFCNEFNNKLVNKYFAGEAVAVTPFFLFAHLISGSEENPADGYSFYYMAAVSFASIFYMLLGLWAIRRLLLRFGIKEGHAAIVLFVIFFATNLSHYALEEEAMSHVYSFAFIACFFLQAHKLFEKFTVRGFLMFSFLFAFIILIRPINFIVIFSLPFIAGSFPVLKTFFLEIFKRPKLLGGGILIAAAVIFIQLLTYYAQCGKFVVYAYSQEGFDFTNPYFFSCLFSYSNGLFVYAPVLFIAWMGIFTFLPKEKFRVFSFIVFFCIVIWVISSWWAWTYSGAFGMRPLIEYYSFFALLLGMLIKTLSKKRFVVAIFFFVLLLPLSVLCQLQIWQYHWGIIGYADMTKEKYWQVFLQTRRQFYYINSDGPPPPIAENAKLVYSDSVDYETQLPGVDWRSITTEKAFSGKHSTLLKSGNNHAPHWKKRMGDILPDSMLDTAQFILGGKAKWFSQDNGTEARMVFIILRDNKIAYYNEQYIIHQVRRENEWTDFKWNIDMPSFAPGDVLEIYARRDNWFPVYIDDLKVELYVKGK
jgi:hypothetical protein